jgi:hypothetical protein
VIDRMAFGPYLVQRKAGLFASFFNNVQHFIQRGVASDMRVAETEATRHYGFEDFAPVVCGIQAPHFPPFDVGRSFRR